MGAFLPNYNDPIVSILLLLGLIFAVSMISYLFSIWKQEQKQKEILKFLKNFESNECIFDDDKIKFEEGMKKPLFLLALSYEKSGEYSKAINLYSYLLKHTNDNSILKNLANSYYKAGFLMRSVDIYKEILRSTPREIDILYKLEFLYEQLREYDKAKEVIDILEFLNQDVYKLKIDIKLQQILRSNKDLESKSEEIVKLLENNPFRWVVLRELFKINPIKAWEYYEDSEFEKLVDILYKLDIVKINLDIISKYNRLKKLYYINGLYNKEFENSKTIFALDLLASAKKNGFEDGDLSFKYICSKCKSSYPLMKYRCPNCHSVYSFAIEVIVEKRLNERGYTL